MECDAKLAVKQKKNEKAASRKLERKNAAKVSTNQKKKEVIAIKHMKKRRQQSKR